MKTEGINHIITAYIPLKIHFCRICPKSYQSRRSLMRHMDKIHQVDGRTHWLFILFKKLQWRLS